MRTKRHRHTQPLVTTRHRQSRTNQLRQALTHRPTTTIQPLRNFTMYTRPQSHNRRNLTRDRIKKRPYTTQALLKQSRRRRRKQIRGRLHPRLRLRRRQPIMLTTTNEQVRHQHNQKPHTWRPSLIRPRVQFKIHNRNRTQQLRTHPSTRRQKSNQQKIPTSHQFKQLRSRRLRIPTLRTPEPQGQSRIRTYTLKTSHPTHT